MENNLENKAKFVAQYLGAQVSYPDTDNKLITCKLHGVSLSEIETTYKRKKKGCVGDILSFKSNGNHNSDFINAYLELKPLEDITDEDFNLITNYGIMNPDPSIGDPVFTFKVGGLRLSDLTTTDFLRSKGYALPWMGLSVDKQIEYGWVKLKEKNDGK
ncbi:hypothetical protein HZP34_02925 [Elizabethkingia anophelis]|nr:hypothetical protein [Elizabethkingia anophelis]